VGRVGRGWFEFFKSVGFWQALLGKRRASWKKKATGASDSIISELMPGRYRKQKEEEVPFQKDLTEETGWVNFRGTERSKHEKILMKRGSIKREELRLKVFDQKVSGNRKGEVGLFY